MKHIIWGMPTLIELNNIEANVKLCKSLGLGFIELNMNLPEYQPDRIDVEKLIYMKEKYNIFFTFHLPEEFDIGHFNENVRTAYIKIFEESVEIAKVLDVPVINVHMNQGVYFTLPSNRVYLYKKYQEEYLDNITKFKHISNKLLKESDISLCIENTGIYDMDYITMATDILLQDNNIYLTWDIGHDRKSGNKDTKYIMDNISKLRHMHFHDTNDTKDHLVLFTGDINIYEKINKAKKHGCYCVIETKTAETLKESVEKLIKYDFF